MKYAVIIFCIMLLLMSCAANKNTGFIGMPQCMVTKMDSIKHDPKLNQPTSVIEYTYKGLIVFYITAGCCDQFNPVYNSDCVYLGAPDGGITGKGDGKLTDFFANATNKKVVWKNK